jgi:hypothetical protein
VKARDVVAAAAFLAQPVAAFFAIYYALDGDWRHFAAWAVVLVFSQGVSRD